MTRFSDVACGRLSEETLALNFADAHPALTHAQSVSESERCFYCYDAPCVEACPTGINIPKFIHAISTENIQGSAKTILQSNIFGGACARVCPTEILCEQKCVRNACDTNQPVRIAALQRYATDWQMRQESHPFARAAATGKRVAIVGAGPAGLACAHRLAMYGHDIALFDAHARPGGLNEYGIAAYKLADDFAQKEIQFLMEIGGIVFHEGKILGKDITLLDLNHEYDAVFLAIGLSGARSLGIEGEQIDGVMDAVTFIEALRSQDKKTVPIGRRVVVIGGGNTAVDAAVQARRLGAEDVSLVYRRGEAHMSATAVERAWARTNDVAIKLWAAPLRIIAEEGGLSGVEFMRGASGEEGRIHYSEQDTFIVPADMVLKAVGQIFVSNSVKEDAITLQDGRIMVDAHYRTTMSNIFAGGDCTAGDDLTVAAVRDGRDAAENIHQMFVESLGS